jgi:hypothetical protein
MSRARTIWIGAAALALAVVLAVVGVRLLAPSGAGAPPGPAAGLPAGRAPTGSAVPKAASALSRYGAIEGSATHLLYATVSRNTGVPVVDRVDSGERYVLRSDGRLTAVPTGWRATVLGDVPLLLRLEPVGDYAHFTRIAWRLPEQSGSGSVPLPAGSTFAGFAPGGWLTQTRIGIAHDRQDGPIERLTRFTTDGTRTDLGVPFPDGAPAALQVTTSGVLAWSAPSDGGDLVPDGKIKYRAWSASSWRTLNPSDPEQSELLCTTASPALVSCGTESSATPRVYSLPSGKSSSLRQSGCGDPQVATMTAFLAITSSGTSASCPAGRLVLTARDGTRTTSTRVFDRFHGPVLAFGRIIVDENREHRLLALRTVGDTPQVVVGRSP